MTAPCDDEGCHKDFDMYMYTLMDLLDAQVESNCVDVLN